MADGREHPGLALSQLPLVGEVIATLAPVRRPPVVVVSLPRSGSSWIGGILGAADDALYLREPLTQAYLKHVGYKSTPCFEWGACADGAAFDRFAGLAFRAIPRFGPTMVPLPKQWRLATRSRKRVVIKEVNPLVVARLWRRFHPKIVMLVRHPAPVALSFHALGWTADQFVARFTSATLTTYGPPPAERQRMSYWEQSGAFQAMVQNVVAASLAGAGCLVVRYEDVCRDPSGELQRIFDYCGLNIGDELRHEIERSSQADDAYAPGRYDTRRNSTEMAGRWRHEMKTEEIEQVRRGYFSCNPLFFTEPGDW